MPSRMKLFGRYGNGLGACFFAFLALYALMQGDVIVTLFWLVVAGLAAFNLYIVEKVAVLTPEEERLSAELRLAGFDRKFPSMANTPETVVRNHGP